MPDQCWNDRDVRELICAEHFTLPGGDPTGQASSPIDFVAACLEACLCSAIILVKHSGLIPQGSLRLLNVVHASNDL